MNRCDICGKFRPWRDLTFCWRWASGTEYPEEEAWFECMEGTGCRA